MRSNFVKIYRVCHIASQSVAPFNLITYSLAIFFLLIIVDQCWYKFDEAIEFANESGLAITDAEIIRTNSTGLTFYNPKLASEHLKSMKNKTITREQKIAFRKKYEAENSVN